MVLATLFGLGIGLLLGLTGAGGGILAMPALTVGLGWSFPMAAPVALLAVGISAALGTLDGLRRRLVRYRAALLMVGVGLLVSPFGLYLSHRLPNRVLMLLFTLVMIGVAVRMMRRVRHGSPPDAGASGEVLDKNCMLDPLTGQLRWNLRCAFTLAGIGSLSGFLTGLLGVGGGFLIVPAFHRFTDVRMQGVVATSLMVVTLISLGTVAQAIYHGIEVSGTGLMFIVATMLGMVGGRLVVTRFSDQLIQTCFAWLCLGVSLCLLFKTLLG